MPKFAEDQIRFKFIDKCEKSEVDIRALPSVELLVAIPNSYPSHDRPYLLQLNAFYPQFLECNDFILDQLNQKWMEETPVLYEMVIFIQDELVELLMQEEKFQNLPVEEGVPVKAVEF